MLLSLMFANIKDHNHIFNLNQTFKSIKRAYLIKKQNKKIHSNSKTNNLRKEFGTNKFLISNKNKNLNK